MVTKNVYTQIHIEENAQLIKQMGKSQCQQQEKIWIKLVWDLFQAIQWAKVLETVIQSQMPSSDLTVPLQPILAKGSSSLMPF